MTRVQILLDKKRFRPSAVRPHRAAKAIPLLVREAIDNLYVSRFSDGEISGMPRPPNRGRGPENSGSARRPPPPLVALAQPPGMLEFAFAQSFQRSLKGLHPPEK